MAERGVELIDFGVGDPRERTPAVHPRGAARQRRRDLEATHWPGSARAAKGDRGLVRRRFGVRLDPDRQVIPTLGSKEAIFSLAHVVVDRDGGRDLVAFTEPGYPVPERGARFAGAETIALPLLEENGFLPDLDALEGLWDRLAILWINYPEQPDGCDRPAPLPGAAGGARPRARLRSRQRRGLHRALVRRAARLGAAGQEPAERDRLQHALEALVHDRLPLRLRRRRRRDSWPRCAPSVRPWEPRRRSSSSAPRSWPGATRRTSKRRGRSIAPSGTLSCLRSSAPGYGSRPVAPGMYLWVEVEGELRGVCRAAARARQWSSRPAPSLARRARATCASRSCRASMTAAVLPRCSRPPCDARARRGGDRCPRPRRDARGRAGRRRLARRRRGSGRDPRVLPAARDRAARRWARSSTATRSRSSTATSSSACGSCPPAVARYGAYLSPRGRADAELREHRRLGRAEHDGGHLGHRRLRRPDRRERPPRGRGRESAACSSRRARGR